LLPKDRTFQSCRKFQPQLCRLRGALLFRATGERRKEAEIMYIAQFLYEGYRAATASLNLCIKNVLFKSSRPSQQSRAFQTLHAQVAKIAYLLLKGNKK
jgi:hypothetical protein